MYTWMNFYSTLFLLLGLFVAASSKLFILLNPKKDKSNSESRLDHQIRDAFAWWGFFSLTFGGMLIPILNACFSYTSTPFLDSPMPIPELGLIIYWGIGVLLTVVRLNEYQHPSKEKKIRSITLSENTLLFLYPYLILSIIFGEKSKLTYFKGIVSVLVKSTMFFMVFGVILFEIMDVPITLIIVVFVSLIIHFLGFLIIRSHP